MKQQIFKNPLDELFDIQEETGDFMEEYRQIPASAVVPVAPVEEKDADDIATDARIDEVYDLALDAYKQQTAMVEIIDPKFAARNAEVAANFLNIALNAATSKAKIKTDRKRATAFNPAAVKQGNTTNNVIVASQEDVLRMLDNEIKKD
jgi:hypothetical protein